jgi:predicted PurR-regulated permease PerM
LLNFVPLLGPVATVVLATVAGLASFDSFTQALLAPGIVAVVHTIETNFVTPAILGKRLTLDPFLVVLSLLLGTWLWGIGGALLAVPILLFSVAAWRAYVLREPRKPPEAPAEPKAAPTLVPPPLGAAKV